VASFACVADPVTASPALHAASFAPSKISLSKKEKKTLGIKYVSALIV
jgi:hypothetical protein